MVDSLDNEKDDEYEFTGDSEEEYTPSEHGDMNVGGPEVNLNAEPELEEPFDPMEGGILGEGSPMRKMLTYAGIGVGTVLIALYLNYRGKSVDEQQGLPDQESAQIVSQAVPPVAIKPAPAPAPVVVSPQMVEAPVVLNEQAKEQLSAFADQIRSNQLSIDNIGVRVQSLESSITKMNAVIDRIDKRLKPQEVKKTPVVKKKPVRKAKKVVRRPVHRDLVGLKAVVPGRAWIQTASGYMLTVRVGQRIPGLGRVKAIDAPAGKVVTSSGAVIGYGPGDY